MAKKKFSNNDVYQMVTDQIIENLEKGVVAWRKPWKSVGADMPKNYITKKVYRGINYWILSFAPFDSNYWLSFKQISNLGGKVKKGEKSTIVTFWKQSTYMKENKEGLLEEKKALLLRYYRVFNADQTEGIKFKKEATIEELKNDIKPIDKLEKIFADMKNAPKLLHKGDRAFYRPATDEIYLPNIKQFNSIEEYYSTKAHEYGHSTGHSSRLDREGISNFDFKGSHQYSKEELVAELTSTYILNIVGLDCSKTFDNSTAYIKGWLEKLRSDNKFIFQASSQAQKSADCILNISFVKKETKKEAKV